MAVIQLSRIKIRRGPDENIDKVLLQEGEMGFTTDTGRIFIGSGNVDTSLPKKDKSPHNIELLTELSDVSALTDYSYRFRDPSHAGFPTELSNRANPDIVRFLQERLDDSVSVKTYGAKGDYKFETDLGTDNTVAIRKAAIDVTNGDIELNRALYFPAGIYRIERPLILPPGSTWIGDGTNRTIIVLTNKDTEAVIRTALSMSLSEIEEFDHNVIVANDDGFDVPEILQMFNDIQASPERIEYINLYGITFVHLGFDQNSLDRKTPLSDLAVAKFEHAAHVNVINCAFEGNFTCAESAAYQAFITGASLIDPTVRTTYKGKAASFRSWQQSNLEFDGTGGSAEQNKLTAGERYEPRRDMIGVIIDSLANGTTSPAENFSFYNCEFNNVAYGFQVTDNLTHTSILSSRFETNYRSVNLNENPSNFNSNLTRVVLDIASLDYNEGPKSFKVAHSHFQHIKDHAFTVTRNESPDSGEEIFYGHSSSYNTYDDVGFTDCDGPTGQPDVAAICLGDGVNGVTTMADTFSYIGAVDALRVKFNNLSSNLIINAFEGAFIPGTTQFPGASSISDTAVGLVIENNRTAYTDFVPPLTFNTGTDNAIIIDYSIVRTDERFRVGTLTILSNGHQDGTNFSEDFIETGPEPAVIPLPFGTGVLFNVLFDSLSNSVKIQYKSTDLPSPGTGIFKFTARSWDGGIS